MAKTVSTDVVRRALGLIKVEASAANIARAHAIYQQRQPSDNFEFVDILREEFRKAPTTTKPAPAVGTRAVPGVAPPSQAVGYNPQSGWELTPDGKWVYHGPQGPGPSAGLQPPPTAPSALLPTLQPPLVDTGGQPAEWYNPAIYGFREAMELQQAGDIAALKRAQLAASTQLSAAQASAQAQLEAQRIANQGALERLRGQLAGSLSEALMQHDISRANLSLDVAQLGADPRSTVGFLEYLGQAGGGPTAISQNLAAGITPSPVWEYMPETQGPSAETQRWLDTLEGFVGNLGG